MSAKTEALNVVNYCEQCMDADCRIETIKALLDDWEANDRINDKGRLRLLDIFSDWMSKHVPNESPPLKPKVKSAEIKINHPEAGTW